jgi:hypothetical protein
VLRHQWETCRDVTVEVSTIVRTLVLSWRVHLSQTTVKSWSFPWHDMISAFCFSKRVAWFFFFRRFLLRMLRGALKTRSGRRVEWWGAQSATEKMLR